MKKAIVIGFALTLCSYALAQDKSHIAPHVVMTNGVHIETTFDNKKQILSIEVQNNDDDVEILVVERDQIVNREITFFKDDELEMDCSFRGINKLDIYARTRNEVRYIGTINTENE